MTRTHVQLCGGNAHVGEDYDELDKIVRPATCRPRFGNPSVAITPADCPAPRHSGFESSRAYWHRETTARTLNLSLDYTWHTFCDGTKRSLLNPH